MEVREKLPSLSQEEANALGNGMMSLENGNGTHGNRETPSRWCGSVLGNGEVPLARECTFGEGEDVLNIKASLRR